MKPDEIQQFAQSFVESWEQQLARGLHEPHMLTSLMAMMQQGGYAPPNFAAPQQSPANPWAAMNPFATHHAAANPFAAMSATPQGRAYGQAAPHAAPHAQSGAAAGGLDAQRLAAMEYELATLRQRVAELEQRLAEPEPASPRARSTASAPRTRKRS